MAGVCKLEIVETEAELKKRLSQEKSGERERKITTVVLTEDKTS